MKERGGGKKDTTLQGKEKKKGRKREREGTREWGEIKG